MKRLSTQSAVSVKPQSTDPTCTSVLHTAGRPSFRCLRNTSPLLRSALRKTHTTALLLTLLLVGGWLQGRAQTVASYTFAQSSGTYTAITGATGTVVATATGNALNAPSLDTGVFNAPIPFTFTFRGTGYTALNISCNGFVTFGATRPGPTLLAPISGSTTYAGAISAFGANLNSVFNLGGATGEIRYATVGTAPNREFVIQWRNFRPTQSISTTDVYVFDFQIRLQETTNSISIVYGGELRYVIGSAAQSSTTNQIGLRGATNADFNNRLNASTLSFTASTAGTAFSSAQSINTTATPPGMPTSGLTYTWAPPVGCSGTPAAGTAQANGTSGVANICPTVPVNFVLNGGTTGVGLTYAWEYSSNGVNYNAITGATNATYTLSNYASSNAGYYRVVTTCTNTSQTATSTPVQLTTNNVAASCYCTPSVSGGATTKFISNFTTSGAANNINNTSGAGNASGFEDYRSTVTAGSAYEGATVSYSISVSTGSSGRAIWIDFNENGSFTDAGEQVVVGTTALIASPLTGTFTIPAGVTAGPKRMRILANSTPGNPTTPCSITGTGEYEDYTFEVLAPTPCSGIPATPTVGASVSTLCPGGAVTLGSGGSSIGQPGISYQWQSSPAGANNFSGIPGATAATFTVPSQTAATDYRLVLTCANGGATATSTSVNVALNPSYTCQCTSGLGGGTTAAITNITIPLTTFSHTGATPAVSPYFTAYPATGSNTGTFYPGQNYTINTNYGSSAISSLWIDYNQSGTFEATEWTQLTMTGTTGSVSFTVPANATLGLTGMRIRSRASGNTNGSGDACTTGFTSGETKDFIINIAPLTPCSGTPATAVASASTNSACSGASLTLNATNLPIGFSEISYQWESRTGTNAFSPISNATTVPYTLTTGQTVATDYRLVITCTNGGGATSTSNTVSVAVNPFYNCYCSSGLGGSTAAAILDATISGTTFNHTGSTSASPFYTKFSATGGNTGTFTQGVTYTISTTHSSTGFASLWIDYDQNGTFDAIEWTQINTATATSGSVSFTVPVGALTGQTGMRIRTRTSVHTGSDACTSFTTGETKDFTITIAAPVPCSGAPTTTISASVTNACSNAPFDLSVSGIPAGITALTYQWQSRPAGGGTFTDINGANNYPYTVTGQAAATDYQLVVTCPNGGATATSNIVSVGQNPGSACYCTPTTASGGGATYFVNNFTTTGGATNINNPSGSSTLGYTDFSASVSGSASAGTTINYSIGISSTSVGFGRGIWIDFDEDGTFQPSEQVVSSTAYSTPAGAAMTGSFTIPILTSAGTKRMRIVGTFTPSNPSNSCANTGQGEYEDYTFVVLPPPPCSGTPTAGTAAASVTSLCASSNTTLSITGFTGSATPVGGITFQWEQSANAGGPFVAVSGGTGATTPAFTTGALTTTTFYRAVVTCTNSGQSATSNVVTVTVSDPALVSVAGGVRCGVGTVILNATPNSGQTVRWYDGATGGTLLATSNSFTTPAINATTTYYAAAVGSTFTGTTGRVTATALGAASGLNNYTIVFNVTQPTVFNSVDVFSGTGTAITVSLLDAGGNNQLQSTSFTTTAGVQNTLPLGWTLAPGTYRLAFSGLVTTTNTFFRETTANTYPIGLFVSGGQVGSITGYTTSLTGTLTTGAAYNYGYNWNLSVSCEGSTRLPVTATVNTPPTLSITPSQAVCNGTAAMMEVTSNTASFNTYSWSPNTNLYTDAAGLTPYTGQNVTTVYVVGTTSGATTYTLSAANNTTQCASQVTNEVAILPTSPTVTATPATLCLSGTSTLALTPASDYGVAGIQWQVSTDNVTFTDITGANNSVYTTGTLTATRYYRAQIKNSLGTVCVQPQATVTVNSPSFSNATGGQRCGDGTVTLTATPSAGATINWYTANTGGTSIFTGNSFTTPVLTSTTNYFVSAASAGSTTGNIGKPTYTGSDGTATNLNTGLVFDATSSFTLNSVLIYPSGTTAGAGTVTIQLQNSVGTMLQTATVNLTAATTPTAQVATLGFAITPGTDYRLVATAFGGNINELYRNFSSSGVAFPYTIPGVASIKSGLLNNNTATTYYYFFDWNILIGCETPRAQVTATINIPPALTLSNATQTVCNDGVAAISVTSPLANFDTYVWSPAANLYTDAAGTIHYVANTSATTVYARSTTAGTATYTVTATNNTTQCTNIENTNVTVLPVVSVSVSPASICVSGLPTATLANGSAFTGAGASITWANSSDGISYTTIPSANGTTYIPGNAISASTFYQATVSLGGSTCGVSAAQALVNNPSVSNVISGSRCGPGTLTLSATPSASATLNWYAAANGGLPLATSNSYTTPVISTNTTYFVSAQQGSNTGVTGRTTATALGAASTLNNYTIVFNVTQRVMLNSVGVFSGTGTAITVSLLDAGGNNQILSTPFTTTAGVQNTLPLGWTLAPGTYRMAFSGVATGNTFFRETTGNTYPIGLTVGNVSVGSITGYTTSLTGTLTTGAAYNYGYNWNMTAWCESGRTAVTATINNAPALTVSPNQTVCSGEVATLSVTSNTADFDTYSWSPVAGLFLDAAGMTPYTGQSATTVYAISSTAGATTYTLNASNSTTQCTNIGTSQVTVLPASPAVNAFPASLCSSGTSTLSLLPAAGYGAATYQWQESTNGGTTFTDIVGATNATYTTQTITASRHYRVQIKNSSNVVCVAPQVQVVVNNPTVSNAVSGSRCGTGTVALSATPSANATLYWYAAATGGTSLASGNSFTTSSINATTNYYVGAREGNTTNITGRVLSTAPTSSVSTATTTLIFTLTQPITLNSVDVFANAGTAMNLSLYDAVGTTPALLTTGAITTTPGSRNTIPIGWTLQPGTYRLGFVPTGTFYREASGVAYPIGLITSGGQAGSITGYTTTIAGAAGTASIYNFGYNWNITSSCESPRTLVTATVLSTPPSVAVAQPSQTVCGNDIATLSVSAGTVSNYGNYVWTPTANLYTNAAATTPYTGGNASTVYAKTATGGTNTYTVNATGGTPGCTNSATAGVVVNPVVVINTQPVAQTVCAGSGLTLSVTASNTGGVNSYQWYQDGNALNGATSATYIVASAAAGNAGNYYVSVGGNAPCAALSSDTVAVSVTPVSPITASATRGTVCSGLADTLNVSSASSNYTYSWNTPSPTTGAQAYVNPTATRYYTVTGTDGVTNCVAKDSVQVTVEQYPTVTFSPSAPSMNCGGSPVQITATINTTGSVTKTVWTPANFAAGTPLVGLYTDAAGTTAYDSTTSQTATSVYVKNSSDVIYTLAVTTALCPATTGGSSVALSVTPSTSNGLANGSGNPNLTYYSQTSGAGGETVQNADCETIATVAQSGGSPVTGLVRTDVYTTPQAPTIVSGKPYVPRYYQITPENNASTATGTLTIYATNADFKEYNTAAQAHNNQIVFTDSADYRNLMYYLLPDNDSQSTVAARLNNVLISKESGTSPSGLPGTFTPGVRNAIRPATSWNAVASRWEMTFSTTGFSGFFIGGGGSGAGPLPVTFTGISATAEKSKNRVEWNVGAEDNVARYEVEKQTQNSGAFEKIGTMPAAGIANYVYYDIEPSKGLNTYRVKAVDVDGAYSYSSSASVRISRSGGFELSLYPNPTSGLVTVEGAGSNSTEATVTVSELSGRVILTQVVSAKSATVDISTLPSGTYMLQWSDGINKESIRITKQ